jgi:hypothetical protein
VEEKRVLVAGWPQGINDSDKSKSVRRILKESSKSGRLKSWHWEKGRVKEEG